MVLGNPKQIDLSTSLFERIREKDCLFVDKTRFIEHFINESSDVQLIVRQRRTGKSLNMGMLRCFLTDRKDNRGLFAGACIQNSPAWTKANSAPTFLFDFKHLGFSDFKLRLNQQIYKQLSEYIDKNKLHGYLKDRYESFINNLYTASEGLLVLTELVYETTGKRSYILIDEYDKLLMDYSDKKEYQEIKDFETLFLSAGLKGNPYLEKALLTGVLRVSRESLLSNLNNLQTYDIFTDDAYVDDFGLSDAEIDELGRYFSFDKATVKEWYNGVRISGVEKYNIYSVVSYLKSSRFGNYWGRSGTIQMIAGLMDENRREALLKMMGGESVDAYVSPRISLNELSQGPDDGAFYSLLVQAGYLALEGIDEENYGSVRIPNKELRLVWKEFILSYMVKNATTIRTLFDRIANLKIFDMDIEDYLSDKLSYYDIAEPEGKTAEKVYHVFVLGLLSAYEDISYKKPPLSNMESGDGRFDILLERKDYCVIFEFKSVENASQLDAAADAGLRQIDEKRYYAGAPKSKPLIKTAIAFYGKRCKAKSSRHEWLFPALRQ